MLVSTLQWSPIIAVLGQPIPAKVLRNPHELLLIPELGERFVTLFSIEQPVA